jgi:hypothetical protein
MATFTTDPSGRMVASSGPALHIPPTQHLTGSLIEAASTKTLASQAQNAAASQSLGAGIKGAGRRKRGGAQNLNATIPYIPEAGTISGVSHTANHLNAVNNLNQLRADAIYDQHINAQPYQVAGRKIRKTKRKANGSRHNRTHRRKRSKSSRNRRGSRRSRK